MELYKKLDVFTDYWFEASTHTYTYNNIPVKASVTQFISNFVKPFEKEKWLEIKSKKLGITPEELALQWQEKADISSETGTIFHAFMENSLAGKGYDFHGNVNTTTSYQEIVHNNLDLLVPLGQRFIAESKHHLIPIRSELTVGIRDCIAGQIDQLFYNTASGKLEIWDWKTNNEIRMTSPFKENMLGVLCMLDACEYTEYSLQLNLYKGILKYHGIETGDCYFVWFNRNKKQYSCYKCLDLSFYVQKFISSFS